MVLELHNAIAFAIVHVLEIAQCYCMCNYTCARNCIMLLRVDIRKLLFAFLLEAPPNVNTSDQDDNKLQNSTECND